MHNMTENTDVKLRRKAFMFHLIVICSQAHKVHAEQKYSIEPEPKHAICSQDS